MPPEPFPISPADFARSDLFQRTFEEGMDLVEETAAYLEGPGREASRGLARTAALAYASESMRLTTHLMQIASWLLVHRAVRDGDMSNDEAREERYRLTELDEPENELRDGLDELPGRLLELRRRCERLYSRVVRLDERLFGRALPISDPNPVGEQLQKLETLLRLRGVAASQD